MYNHKFTYIHLVSSLLVTTTMYTEIFKFFLRQQGKSSALRMTERIIKTKLNYFTSLRFK